jgi:ribosomal protein L32
VPLAYIRKRDGFRGEFSLSTLLITSSMLPSRLVIILTGLAPLIYSFPIGISIDDDVSLSKQSFMKRMAIESKKDRRRYHSDKAAFHTQQAKDDGHREWTQMANRIVVVQAKDAAKEAREFGGATKELFGLKGKSTKKPLKSVVGGDQDGKEGGSVGKRLALHGVGAVASTLSTAIVAAPLSGVHHLIGAAHYP